jgi:hypothetical protein
MKGLRTQLSRAFGGPTAAVNSDAPQQDGIQQAAQGRGYPPLNIQGEETTREGKTTRQKVENSDDRNVLPLDGDSSTAPAKDAPLHNEQSGAQKDEAGPRVLQDQTNLLPTRQIIMVKDLLPCLTPYRFHPVAEPTSRAGFLGSKSCHIAVFSGPDDRRCRDPTNL